MLDIAVIGSGAIAEEAYLPAIGELPSARLAWIVDVDGERARSLATRFDARGHATDDRIVLESCDAAVIATPPRFHAEIAERCLDADIHVFTEKPIATTSERGRELIALADEHGVHFAISRQLRESPACRAVRQFAQSGTIGELERVTMHFGDETEWSFASDYRVRKSLSWGGVLTDKAPHALDILRWILGPNAMVTRYRDDNLGGLEANAEVDLAFRNPDVTARLEVTADREITNELVVVGTDGRLIADPQSASARLIDREGDEYSLQLRDSDQYARYRPRVAKQLERFVTSIQTDSPTYVPAAEGLELVEWIESCYDSREPLIHSWEQLHLERAVAR